MHEDLKDVYRLMLKYNYIVVRCCEIPGNGVLIELKNHKTSYWWDQEHFRHLMPLTIRLYPTEA